MKKIGTALYYAGVLIVLVTALAGEISGYGVVIALIGFVLVAWYPFRSATMITRRRKG